MCVCILRAVTRVEKSRLVLSTATKQMEPSQSSQHHWLEWLKQSYSEAPAEGPDAKRVKFSTIHERLSAQFPTDSISAAASSHALQTAFPNTQKKRIGHERQTYIFGMEDAVLEEQSTVVGSSTQDLRVQNELLSNRVRELEAKVCELEEFQTASSGNLQLNQQFGTLLHHGRQVLCGPDTPTHFTDFSMKIITEEIQSSAPDVYQLFVQLGNTDRNAREGESPAEQKKALMSLCTLLNARSQKANGLQLLIGFMLIARATSKQVRHCAKNALPH